MLGTRLTPHPVLIHVVWALLIATFGQIDVDSRTALMGRMSCLSTEHYFAQGTRKTSPRPRRKLSTLEAKATFDKIPDRRNMSGVFPWMGEKRWLEVATADADGLRVLMTSTDAMRVWGAIAEAAWRREPTLESDLAHLAQQGWGPAAWAIGQLPGKHADRARPLLSSKSPSVSLWAALTLARAGDRRGALPVLDFMRKNRTPLPVIDLGGIGKADLAEALIPFLRDDAKALYELVELTGRRFAQVVAVADSSAARRALEKMALEDHYHGMRRWAVTGLAMRPDGRSGIERAAKQKKYADTAAYADEVLKKLKQGLRPHPDMNGYVDWRRSDARAPE